jgi:hypothetical protein
MATATDNMKPERMIVTVEDAARLRQHDLGDAEKDDRRLPTCKQHGKGQKRADSVQNLALTQAAPSPNDL